MTSTELNGSVPATAASRLRLRRPVVWIDLETTGLNVGNDRIVEISVVKEWPDGRLEERTRRVNPEMPIPPEASAVHGICDADVCDEPCFAQLAKGFAEFLAGADLGGFGIARFDVPLLEEEFKRAGVAFSCEGRAVLDAKEIFHRYERRDLAAAYRFYLQRELIDPHRSSADARASREILHAQLERYPELPADSATLGSSFERERSPFLVLRDGEPCFNTGKHIGESLRDVARRAPDYLDWMLRKGVAPEWHEHIQLALAAVRHPLT
jgi:DNA polymerase-3 subunit epsilon